MSKSATHTGHCQICDSIQALPNGVLSLHGYNVRWSSFIGICPGAKHLPFEEDKSLAERQIRSVHADVAHLETQAATLRALQGAAPEHGYWVHVYIPAAWGPNRTRIASRYEWRQVELQTELVHDYPRFFYVDGDGKRQKVEASAMAFPKTLQAMGADLNEGRAKSFDHHAKQLRDYIQWQEARCAAWTPQPLTPRKAEGRKGPLLHATNPKHDMFTVCGARRRSIYGSSTKHCVVDHAQVTCPKCAAKLAEVSA